MRVNPRRPPSSEELRHRIARLERIPLRPLTARTLCVDVGLEPDDESRVARRSDGRSIFQLDPGWMLADTRAVRSRRTICALCRNRRGGRLPLGHRTFGRVYQSALALLGRGQRGRAVAGARGWRPGSRCRRSRGIPLPARIAGPSQPSILTGWPSGGRKRVNGAGENLSLPIWTPTWTTSVDGWLSAGAASRLSSTLSGYMPRTVPLSKQ